MRIVTRPDFDGVVCAVLLYDALSIDQPVVWTEPGEIQKNRLRIASGDIIANLPYHPDCSLWFDHHFSNQIDAPFEGGFEIAPSAAGVVYRYFQDRLHRDYHELVSAADKIDSADLTLDEVQHPEDHPFVILSMTMHNQDMSEAPYWNHLVDQLRTHQLEDVMADDLVAAKCRAVVAENQQYEKLLREHTVLNHHVSITDFRPFDKMPNGNRFLVYSMFPDAVVSLKIRYDDNDRDRVIVSAGHSIFNRGCQVNVGSMFAAFEGGGHKGAGACSFHRAKTDDYLPKIIDILLKNQPNT